MVEGQVSNYVGNGLKPDTTNGQHVHRAALECWLFTPKGALVWKGGGQQTAPRYKKISISEQFGYDAYCKAMMTSSAVSFEWEKNVRRWERSEHICLIPRELRKSIPEKWYQESSTTRKGKGPCPPRKVCFNFAGNYRKSKKSAVFFTLDFNGPSWLNICHLPQLILVLWCH